MARYVKTVLGFCPTPSQAEEAVDKLRLSGFRNTDVSALIPEGSSAVRGVLSWPAGSGLSRQLAENHEDWLSHGGILICVRCATEDWEKRAERVLQRSMAAAS